MGAAWNTANVEAGSTVAIFGLGAVGLAVSKFQSNNTLNAQVFYFIYFATLKYIWGKEFKFQIFWSKISTSITIYE